MVSATSHGIKINAHLDYVSRPSTTKSRVHPSDLRDYRMSHRMLGPCCFCPLAEETQPDYVEAPIYMASLGESAGQYVASCARDRCGYFGESMRYYFRTIRR